MRLINWTIDDLTWDHRDLVYSRRTMSDLNASNDLNPNSEFHGKTAFQLEFRNLDAEDWKFGSVLLRLRRSFL